jgi:hypothetical protein
MLLTTAFTLTSYSQSSEKINCEKIVLNDSLFKQQSDPYSFDIKTGNIVHNVLNHQIQNINNIITVDESCLKFRISFSCGCGTNEKKLVTNGQLIQDEQGLTYYEIKLLFTNLNKGCQALCHDQLAFDISELQEQTTDTYLKFEGFEHLIKL